VTVRVFDYEPFTSGSRIVLDEGTLDDFRTGGLLNGPFTVVAVFKRLGDTTDTYQYLISLNASGSVRAALSLAGDQPSTEAQFDMGGGAVTFGIGVDDDVWCVYAVRYPGGSDATAQGKVWDLDGETDSGWQPASGTRDQDSNALTSIELGNRPSDFAFNGKLHALAVYADDIGEEAADDLDRGPDHWPTEDLVGLWVLDQASTSTPVEDLVGAADQTSITGTSVDDEDTPPYRQAGGGTIVTGEASVQLGALTATGAGRRRVYGTAAVSLGGLTAAGTGRRLVHGTAAATLGGLTAAGTGQRVVHGQATAELGALTATGAGRRRVYGTATTQLGALTVHGSAAGAVSGTASVQLGGLAVPGTGRRRVHGTAAVTSGGLTAAATGKRRAAAIAAVQLGALAATAAGHRRVYGACQVLLGGLTAHAATGPGPVGTGPPITTSSQPVEVVTVTYTPTITTATATAAITT
jgi:hypothetical protein